MAYRLGDHLMKTDEQVLKEARQRGYDRGLADKKESIYRKDILSGEWAGESITELLGDLLGGYDEMQQDWVCDEYVMGYEEANEPEEEWQKDSEGNWGSLAS